MVVTVGYRSRHASNDTSTWPATMGLAVRVAHRDHLTRMDDSHLPAKPITTGFDRKRTSLSGHGLGHRIDSALEARPSSAGEVTAPFTSSELRTLDLAAATEPRVSTIETSTLTTATVIADGDPVASEPVPWHVP